MKQTQFIFFSDFLFIFSHFSVQMHNEDDFDYHHNEEEEKSCSLQKLENLLSLILKISKWKKYDGKMNESYFFKKLFRL